MDATIIVALIVAVNSFLLTFATAVFNLLIQLRIKKLDLKELNYQRTIQFKRTMYEDYLKSLSITISQILQGYTSVDLEEYSSYYALVMIYSTPTIKKLAEDMHFDLINKNESNLFQKMQSMITEVHLELNSLLINYK